LGIIETCQPNQQQGQQIVQKCQNHHWISIFYSAKHMYVQYDFFIVNMHIKSCKNEVILKNLNALCNIKLILGLPCTLLMFECVRPLIQNCTTFECVCVWFCGQIHQTSLIRVILVVLWSCCHIQSSNFWWLQFNYNFTNKSLPLNWFLKFKWQRRHYLSHLFICSP
jgi:hypothetical protein